MTFRTRLVLAATVAAVLAVLFSSTGSYLAARHALLNSVDDSLVVTAERGLATGRLDAASFTGVAVQVVAPDGEVVATTGLSPFSQLPVDAAARQVASGQADREFTTVAVGGTELREYVLRFPGPVAVSGHFLPDGGALQLAAPLTGVNSQLGALGLALTLVAVAAVALAVVLGWLVARAAIGPLNSLTARLEVLAQTTDVSERVDPGGIDELGRLRRAFNRLLSALERSREAQRQLVLDAAHELRTPLTSLRTNLEVIRRLNELPPADRELLVDDVLTQMEELTDLVGDLAELARGEHLPRDVVPLRLDQLVEDAVAVARTHGRSRGVQFAVVTEPTWVRGNPDRIGRAVGNLLDNALKWSPDAGVVDVVCTAGTMTVRDHGPGIDPTDLPHIFDRFYRSPDARALPGSGLGLAIVAQVIEAEQGSVAVDNAPVNGTVFTISLPEIAAPVPVPGAADDE
jgi:two-component system sensor histidine kinase MprB